MDPASYLVALAKSSPQAYYIDLDAQYNTLFIQRVPPSLAITQGDNLGLFAARNSLPANPLSIQLRNGTLINVEWKVQYNFIATQSSTPPSSLPFNNVADFEAYCGFASLNTTTAQPPTKRSAEPYQRRKNGDATLEPYFVDAANLPVAIKALPNNEASYFNLGIDTGVIQLPILAPPASSSEANVYVRSVAQLVNEALAYFKKQGFTRVLVDVSRNPGGDIVAGLAVFQQIFSTSTPYYGQDTRYSPLLANLTHEFAAADTNQSIALNFKYSVQQNGSSYRSVDAFLGPVYKKGGYFTRPSRRNAQAYLASWQGPGNLSIPARPLFALEQIGLLSDGLCISTCAAFIEAMRKQGVRSVVYGGHPGSKTLQVSGGTRG